MSLIFALSAQADLVFSDVEIVDTVVRKVGHMGVFGILAVLLARPLRRVDAPHPLLTALVVTVLFAITDELHQGMVDGRAAAATDVALDGLGGALGLLIYRRGLWRRGATLLGRGTDPG